MTSSEKMLETLRGIRALAVDRSARFAHRLVHRLAEQFPREHPPCPIGSDTALDVAIITPPEAREPGLMRKLDAVAGRVLEKA